VGLTGPVSSMLFISLKRGIGIPHLVSRQPLPVAKHHELHLAIGSDLALQTSGLGVRCQCFSFPMFNMIESIVKHPLANECL